ncbi:MAG: hypothetical protein KIT61_17105 [Pyrinomonadaceae bacterium]|nr:hypothetical protein [Pyrinomonadaceae bacterium]
MMRKILAFLVFNIYGALISAAFELNVPNIFDNEKLSELAALGFSLDRNALGWNDHYIYRFFASLVATAFAAVIAGAFLSKATPKKGQYAFKGVLDVNDPSELEDEITSDFSIARRAGVFMLIANIPTIAFWGIVFYLLTVHDDPTNTSKFYFKWMSLIAIPVTTAVAYLAGREGAQSQIDNYENDRPFGVKAGHWIWIAIPFYLYSISIIAVAARLLQNFWYSWGDEGLLGSLIYLLSIIPLMAYIYPLQYSHQILAGKWMPDRSTLARAGAVAGILVGGFIFALAIDIGSVFGLAALGYTGKPSKKDAKANVYTVNTAEKWCDVLNGEDLAKKNNVDKVEYDVSAIRTDYVDKLNLALIERLSNDADADHQVDEKITQQLKAEKRLGAWIEHDGDLWRLHVADSLFPSDLENKNELIDKWIKDWRERLETDRSNSEDKNAEINCPIRSLDNFFDELVIHADDRQEEIKLRHTARTFEKEQ